MRDSDLPECGALVIVTTRQGQELPARRHLKARPVEVGYWWLTEGGTDLQPEDVVGWRLPGGCQ